MHLLYKALSLEGLLFVHPLHFQNVSTVMVTNIGWLSFKKDGFRSCYILGLFHKDCILGCCICHSRGCSTAMGHPIPIRLVLLCDWWHWSWGVVIIADMNNEDPPTWGVGITPDMCTARPYGCSHISNIIIYFTAVTIYFLPSAVSSNS